MSCRRVHICSAISVFLAIVVMVLPAVSETAGVRITGNTPPVLSQATLLGHHDSNAVLDIVVGLTLQHEHELESLIERLHNPSSSDYLQFITPAQFNSRYAPTQESVDMVTAFLESQGLSVIEVTSNHTLIQARGTVSQIERAFRVSIKNYIVKGAIANFHPVFMRLPEHANTCNQSNQWGRMRACGGDRG
jgi:subtilase family serine protease